MQPTSTSRISGLSKFADKPCALYASLFWRLSLFQDLSCSLDFTEGHGKNPRFLIVDVHFFPSMALIWLKETWYPGGKPPQKKKASSFGFGGRPSGSGRPSRSQPGHVGDPFRMARWKLAGNTSSLLKMAENCGNLRDQQTRSVAPAGSIENSVLLTLGVGRSSQSLVPNALLRLQGKSSNHQSNRANLMPTMELRWSHCNEKKPPNLAVSESPHGIRLQWHLSSPNSESISPLKSKKCALIWWELQKATLHKYSS